MPGISPTAISPMFGKRGSRGTPFPPPAYAIFSIDGVMQLTSISAPGYQFGSGPGASSVSFSLYALGLVPAAGNITITPPADIEVYNPNDSTWYSVPFNVAYTGGAKTQSGYMVRLKAGLTANVYSENVIITASNTIPFNTLVTGTVAAVSFIQATGGIITTSGNDKIHTFNGDGIFEIIQLSTNPIFNNAQYLIIAGGGGGGRRGGGGAGGVLSGISTMIVQSYPVTIGSGGMGYTFPILAKATNGSNSSFNSFTGIGGGGGGTTIDTNLSNYSGSDGGSGGGAASDPTGNIAGNPGSGTVGQGKNGGNPQTGALPYAGGGGGGYTTNGADATSTNGGNGGSGYNSSISGSSMNYGGGGGGGAFGFTAGTGGTGGGGNGSIDTNPGSNGSANTGGGAGGSGDGSGNGGNGGSGIIIIRYRYQ